ncbi:MAG TPA: sensor histidine kinase [Casimicrobiaceae bacterium]|nr:sensor histidine kinase [Casimicrobiaceae bacterium]
MNSNHDSARGFAAVARHLRERRDKILDAWRRAAQRDPQVTTSVALSRAQFYDHIPRILDALERRLLADDLRESLEAQKDENETAEGHGLLRWQQGYDDEEVMREWVALNACLADEVQAFADAHPELSPSAVAQACRHVAEVTINGMSESVAQYTRLARIEASERVGTLQQAIAQLGELEKQRAEAWRQAAHDLRGNVHLVENVAAVIEKTGPSEKFLRMLGRGVASLHALLDDLTAQARLDAGLESRSVRRFDAGVTLSQLAASLQLVAADRGLYLITEGDDSLVVDGDEVKVSRIAQNLLLNALKYTTQGGIKLGWETAGGDATRWCLTVQDTGPGLGNEALEPLAAALETATRDGAAVELDAARRGAVPTASPAPTLPSESEAAHANGGEGVGLSIVKRLCELLDAKLELHTNPGQGTTFRVTFPTRYPKG